MKEVFTTEDGTLISVHDVDQAVSSDAYAFNGQTVRSFIMEDSAIPPITTIDRATGVQTQGKLSAAFMAGYVMPVPESVTSTQGKRTLLYAGIKSAVEAALAAISDDIAREDSQLQYDAGTWERSNSLFTTLGTALGLTSVQIDDLFRAAFTDPTAVAKITLASVESTSTGTTTGTAASTTTTSE
ncbi:hypothetical protein SAMN05216548_1053 [Faunimonas pinastri]|uniref:Uncharacterized protein n=1 Tax=Faunimonas pinastri TaxID=1855383 RepID=A0A1H9GD45_9HYPH|nr:hypothetical protein [Faunimonas pinastri]SEQ48014.1 hypothetical protein SAMN05216548_1053 [Faunimonas pinastri]